VAEAGAAAAAASCAEEAASSIFSRFRAAKTPRIARPLGFARVAASFCSSCCVRGVAGDIAAEAEAAAAEALVEAGENAAEWAAMALLAAMGVVTIGSALPKVVKGCGVVADGAGLSFLSALLGARGGVRKTCAWGSISSHWLRMRDQRIGTKEREEAREKERERKR